MRPSDEYLRIRDSFITEELARRIREDLPLSRDRFTGVEINDSRGYPKTFRIGKCVGGDSDPDNDVFLQVQLFWYREKDEDKQIMQTDRTIEMIRKGDRWVVATATDGFRR